MQRKGIGIRGLLPLGDMVRADLTEKVVGAKTWTRRRVWAVRLSGRRRNAFLEHDLTGYLITSSCAYWPSLSALQTPWPPPSHLRALHTLFQSLSLLPSHPWLLDQLLILQVLYINAILATHSSILAWRILWTEEPGGLQSTGSQRAGHNWATKPTDRLS